MRRQQIVRFVIALHVLCLSGCAALRPSPTVRFLGEIRDEDISAVAAFDRFLVLASDEGTQLVILDREGDGWSYRSRGEAVPLLPTDDELDLEGLARSGDTLFAIGSHSVKRKRVKKGKKYATNRKRMGKVEEEPGRSHLFRLQIDPADGTVGAPVEVTSLRAALDGDAILARFASIPSKENGIDIEGIAADGETLYVGFRSPVLRSNLVPVLETTFADPSSYALSFVNLDGAGIRDLTRVEGGFLILAGPPADADGAYALYFWDGSDAVPGSDRDISPAVRLAPVETPAGGKAEGLAVLGRDGRCYRLVVVFDGVPGGAPAVLRVCLPDGRG